MDIVGTKKRLQVDDSSYLVSEKPTLTSQNNINKKPGLIKKPQKMVVRATPVNVVSSPKKPTGMVNKTPSVKLPPKATTPAAKMEEARASKLM